MDIPWWMPRLPLQCESRKMRVSASTKALASRLPDALGCAAF